MIRRLLGAVASAALLATTAALSTATTAEAAPGGVSAEHRRIVSFWTVDKVRQAKSRDFVYDETTGKFRLNAQPMPAKGKPDKGTGALGSDWNGGGLVQKTIGKVLFQMGGSYYVCSASSTKDANSEQTVITTAAHCVYDNATQSYSTNWMFVPDYDATPVSLDGSGNFCASTTYGCWTAKALVAPRGFTSQTGFNTQATLYDFAFAVTGAGGHNGTQLDATVGAQDIAFTKGTLGAQTYLFGYPASRPYDGTRLIHSYGALGTDPKNSNLTYRVASNMTGGCSGGPWLQPFSASGGAGTQMSVNSYGYSKITYMHGPVFNATTKALYDVANTAVSGHVTV